MKSKPTLLVFSYKKAQTFKKDYIRLNGQFLKFQKGSANHKILRVSINEGDELDARGSVYEQGATKWSAHKCQSWAKFKMVKGEIVALDYDGNQIDPPAWAKIA